jgi:hypothetical protein
MLDFHKRWRVLNAGILGHMAGALRSFTATLAQEPLNNAVFKRMK